MFREPWTRRPSIRSAGTVIPEKPTARTTIGWNPGTTFTTLCSMPLRSSISRAACEGWESEIE